MIDPPVLDAVALLASLVSADFKGALSKLSQKDNFRWNLS